MAEKLHAIWARAQFAIPSFPYRNTSSLPFHLDPDKLDCATANNPVDLSKATTSTHPIDIFFSKIGFIVVVMNDDE